AKAEIARQVEELDRDLKQQMLRLGATGRLVMTGVVEVKPLDDDGPLEAAKPIRPDGKVGVDPKNLEERHDAQVRRILATDGPVPLIVLGASHDLSESVRKLGKGEVEYVMVTTKKVKELAGR